MVLPYADDDARIIDDREWPEEDPYDLQRQRDIDEEKEMNQKAAHEEAFKSWLHRQGDMTAKSLHLLVRKAFFDGASYGAQLCRKINQEALDDMLNKEKSDD